MDGICFLDGLIFASFNGGTTEGYFTHASDLVTSIYQYNLNLIDYDKFYMKQPNGKLLEFKFKSSVKQFITKLTMLMGKKLTDVNMIRVSRDFDENNMELLKIVNNNSLYLSSPVKIDLDTESLRTIYEIPAYRIFSDIKCSDFEKIYLDEILTNLVTTIIKMYNHSDAELEWNQLDKYDDSFRLHHETQIKPESYILLKYRQLYLISILGVSDIMDYHILLQKLVFYDRNSEDTKDIASAFRQYYESRRIN
jgi:hypothetical protein